MGQLVRNVSYNPGTKVLSVEGMHGNKFNVHFDDVDDALLQGDRKGTKPASAGTITIDQKTGTATFDTTSRAFTVGTKHTVRFVDAASGHVTLQSTFTA
jgi:hypothetical protein